MATSITRTQPQLDVPFGDIIFFMVMAIFVGIIAKKMIDFGGPDD